MKNKNEKRFEQLVLSFISSKYVLSLFVILTLVNLGFYCFYLYLIYSNDREAVRPYYDDEKKKLRSTTYVNIWYGIFFTWFIISIFFSLFVFEKRVRELGNLFAVIFTAILFGIIWIIDRLAASIADKKKAQPVTRNS